MQGGLRAALFFGALPLFRFQDDFLHMATRSKDTLFNAALLRCGREDTTTGGSGPLWRAMDANYDEIVRAAFEEGDGTLPFGKSRETLTSRSPGSYGYDDAYTLPNEALHVIEIFVDDYAASDIRMPWEVAGNKVHLDADGRVVEAEFVVSGQEASWSSNFALGVQRRLEAVIQTFLEEPEEAEIRERQADTYFMKAGIKGAKNRSGNRAWKHGGGRLIRARRYSRSKSRSAH